MRGQFRSQLDIIISLIITISIVVIDRASKHFIDELLDLGESIPVIRDVFHITLVHNTGIAFGFFKDQGIVFIVIPVIAIILLIFNIYYYKKNDEALSHTYITGFSLILGGAIGNLIDRIIFGYVIDFIDVRFWPVFNVADSAITVGAAIIAWKCLQLNAKKDES
ncbi:MAG: signal peptidase II [Candidatus Omnitrophica bacterium]|nr:signal peptidase II [Candidatus Omnitrophota bacterium]